MGPGTFKGLFLLFMGSGVPVAIAMAGASLIYVLVSGNIPDYVVIHRMVGGLDSFPLLAVPFFILAGNLMNSAPITNRIYNSALALVGCLNDKTGATLSSKNAKIGTEASALVVQGGVRAVKVIFKVSVNGGTGSFDSAPTNGTSQGAGVSAVRFYNGEGSQIARPDWLTSVAPETLIAANSADPMVRIHWRHNA